MNNLNNLNIKELEEMYQKCSKGASTPELMMIRCEECKRGFALTKGGENEICEHLQKWLNKK